MLGEWDLLQRLAERNANRLTDLSLDEGVLRLRLLATPSPLRDGTVLSQHNLLIGFPVHYPALPMTMHLETAVLHPNVHPRSGFVCLWTDHKVSNTVEHALHKTVAILGWHLFNAEAMHVMQPDALPLLQQATQQRPAYPPLLGVDHEAVVLNGSTVRRRRLS